MALSKWSWTASNGSATATQTNNFYKVFTGVLPAQKEYFSYKVWNDLVDKINELLAYHGRSWDTTYTTLDGAKVSAGESLSAVKYNSARNNLHFIKASGISKVNAGDAITDKHFLTLTETINTAIG